MCSPVAEALALLPLGRNRSYESESGLELFFDERGLIGSSLARRRSWLGKEKRARGKEKVPVLEGCGRQRMPEISEKHRRRDRECWGLYGQLRSMGRAKRWLQGSPLARTVQHVRLLAIFRLQRAGRTRRLSAISTGSRFDRSRTPAWGPLTCLAGCTDFLKVQRWSERQVGEGGGQWIAQAGQGFHLIDRPAGLSSPRGFEPQLLTCCWIALAVV